jgi:hypothetical protein
MKNPVTELLRVADDDDAPTLVFGAAVVLLGLIFFAALLVLGRIIDWLWDAHWVLGAFAIILPFVGAYKEVTRESSADHDR